MKRVIVMMVVLMSVLAGCMSTQAERKSAARGALIGAAGGALISAATGGDLMQGAAIGAAGGATIGVIRADGKERRVYRDNNGRRYWNDDRNQRRYVR